jgi:hypothetical protein
MRPSLSALEYGAKGTPSSIVSSDTAGPQPSVVGSADTRSRSDAGAMLLWGVLMGLRACRRTIIIDSCGHSPR